MHINKITKWIYGFIICMLIIGGFSLYMSVKSYQLLNLSLIDRMYNVGLNRDMSGFATEFPYIYSYGKYGLVIVNTLPGGKIKILPNDSGFSTIFESVEDSDLNSLRRAYGERLIIIESLNELSDKEQNIIKMIMNQKPRFDRDTWVPDIY